MLDRSLPGERGPNAQIPAPSLTREKRVWTGAALRCLLQKVPIPQFQTVPLTGVPWGFYTQSNVPESKISVGKTCDFIRWGKDDCEKGGGRKNCGPGRGGLRPINFRDRFLCEARNLEIDSIKTFCTSILRGKSSCLPRGLSIPVSSDLGWADYGTEIKRK